SAVAPASSGVMVATAASAGSPSSPNGQASGAALERQPSTWRGLYAVPAGPGSQSGPAATRTPVQPSIAGGACDGTRHHCRGATASAIGGSSRTASGSGSTLQVSGISKARLEPSGSSSTVATTVAVVGAASPGSVAVGASVTSW